MSDTKHTPGPWVIGNGPLKFPAVFSFETGYKVCDLSMCGETMGSFAFSGKQSEVVANASLIAAAPELLAELKDVLALFDIGLIKGFDELKSSIRSAIAKAEGAEV